MSDSILTLIDSARWRKALFTSFTLSLTYVESHVLPRLRKQGCQSMSIYADLAGYRDSLMEQRARAVGRDYSVIPVAVNSGIFHPKLVHLQAEEGDEDLLLVGSGNLTFPGHGGNVEVLEVLRPSLHAVAFRQAADFINRLVKTPRVAIADAAPLLESARRLADVAHRGTDAEAIEFVDSLNSSGLDQVIARARSIAPSWDELLVLSPYHHPKAEPVRELLTAVGAHKLIVGVSTKKEPSSFPFDVAETFGLDAIAVKKPVTEKGSGRSLHAKWIELRRPGNALVFSGSFNATRESLCTTNNVECGVLRLLHSDTSDLWADSLVPQYVRAEFPIRSGQKTLCLFASFETPSRLVGRFVGSRDVARHWQARLQNAEDILDEGDIEVAEDGCFTWELNAPIDEITVDTLQLTLTQGDSQARGWVQVSRVLQMSASDRVLLRALARVSRGTGEEDDTYVVLDYIAKEAANIFDNIQTKRITNIDSRTGHGTDTDNNDDKTLSADEFQSLQDPWAVPARYDSGSLLDALKRSSHGWDPLRHICAALLGTMTAGHGNKTKGPNVPGSWLAFNRGEPIVPDDESGDEERKRLEAQLEKVHGIFSEEMKAAERAFLRARTPQQRYAIDVGRSRLLLVASLVEMHFRLMKLGDVERTLDFLWRWLGRVCDLQLGGQDRDLLGKQICGIAAACSLWLLETRWRPNDLTHDPKQIHRLLARLFAGEFDPAAMSLSAAEWLADEAGLALVQGRGGDALEALRLVLHEPTELEVLAQVLRDGLNAHRSLARQVFDPINYTLLEKFAGGYTTSKPAYRPVNVRALTACPKCHVSLTWVRSDGYRELEPDINSRLRKLGFAQCRCGTWLVAKEVA